MTLRNRCVILLALGAGSVFSLSSPTLSTMPINSPSTFQQMINLFNIERHKLELYVASKEQALNARIYTLEQKVNTTIDELAKTTSELNKEKTKSIQLEQEIDRLTMQMFNSTMNNNKLQAKVHGLESRNTALENELIEINSNHTLIFKGIEARDLDMETKFLDLATNQTIRYLALETNIKTLAANNSALKKSFETKHLTIESEIKRISANQTDMKQQLGVNYNVLETDINDIKKNTTILIQTLMAKDLALGSELNALKSNNSLTQQDLVSLNAVVNTLYQNQTVLRQYLEQRNLDLETQLQELKRNDISLGQRIENIEQNMTCQICTTDSKEITRNQTQALSTHSSLRCDKGFVRHGGSCYLFSHETATWVDALLTCQLLDSQLVEINDATENHFIKTSVKLLNAKIGWLIGATDKAVEGEFVWMNSKNWTLFTDWHPTEPTNSNADESCVFVSKGESFQWADVSCETRLNYICETKSFSGPSQQVAPVFG